MDACRSWFRYHQLFADLLQLELRRTAPSEVPALHETAAGWFAGHGYPVEAVRHAQAAQDWGLAARLLCDHWLGLQFDGQAATAHELLTAFPAGVVAVHAELAALMAADELSRGSLEDAERYLAHATRASASVPADRRACFRVMLAILRLSFACQRSDLPAVGEEAQRLLAPAEAPDAAQRGLGVDLRALSLISLGIAELWSLQLEEADRHLEQGVTLAHRIGRPYLELSSLAHWAIVAHFRSSALAAELSTQAIELARRHGWTEEPITGAAYAELGAARVWQGRLEEAERWLGHAERVLQSEVQPATGLVIHYARGVLELACGRDEDALRAFRAAERLAGLLVTPHPFAMRTQAFLLHILARMGETGRAGQALAGMDEQERETGEMRIALAVLRLARHDPQAATAHTVATRPSTGPAHWACSHPSHTGPSTGHPG